MPIYIAQFVIMEENLWRAKTEPHAVIRRHESYGIATRLFLAADAESAYQRASEMCEGMSDANNDGPGDRTNFSCPGLRDLECVSTSLSDLVAEMEDVYGLEVGIVDLGEARPEVQARERLSCFRWGR